MEFYERLFQAIKNDDAKAFKDCMVTNYCGSLRLGRFPVLSVMYLYNSRRLIRAYEKKFLKHNSWQDVGEPSEIATKFRVVAGKCLRLYLSETVSPLEMLLLLDRNTKLKRVFKDAHITAPVKQRLKEIYYVRWGLEADFVRGKIILQRRPLTKREKWIWTGRAVCIVLCLAVFASTPFVVNAISPFITDELGTLHVTRWRQIDFASDKSYTLENDVAIPEDFYVEEFNCKLVGNGHTVTLQGNSAFGDFNGSISDITIVTNGALFADNIKGSLTNAVFNTNGVPIAEDVQATGILDGVTVNVNVDCEISEATGFVVNKNHGLIENVAVNVTGRLKAILLERTDEDVEEKEESFNCGGIVAHNYMLSDQTRHYENVINCTVNYDGFVLDGQLEANASFAGVVGTNEGIVEGCRTNGVITANTFDVAGICAENRFWIETSENGIDVYQSSGVEGWNPLASGIVLLNYYVVDQCVNRGDISSVSTVSYTSSEGGTPCAYATGIAYENIGAYVQLCENYGNISATATAIDADASGICSVSNGLVIYCVNNGDVSANSKNLVEVAGITTVSYGYVRFCANNGKIVAKSNNDAYVGGIVASSDYVVEGCVSNGALDVDGNYSFVGGILGRATLSVSEQGVYCGAVYDCVATCEISVKSGVQLDVGGIVGFAQETAKGESYTLSAVRGCYFVGKFQVASGANLGAIAGVVGENTYNASNSAEKNENKNFLFNYYSEECGVGVAFGAALNDDNRCVSVEDIGASRVAQAVILSDTIYLEILQNATSQPHTHE